MANSTLSEIRSKIRRLTRSPSPSQVTDDEIDQYINTFVLYDMPENLRLFTLKTNFTFFTEPYVDEYDSDNASTELHNFKNKYITFHDPVYVAGQLVPFFQDRVNFFAAYPKSNTISLITYGDGATTNFTGTLSSFPVLKNQVLFSSIDANGNSLELHDTTSGSGITGVLTGSGTGTINYVTGAYDITFTNPPANSANLNSQTVPYLASKPQSLLYFNNKFTVRPVPDQAYRVELEAYIRPTELLLVNQSPDLEQWYQYIAFGAAINLLYDRLDVETVSLLMPMFQKQEILVERRSTVQKSRNSVQTIFDSGICINKSPFRRW